MGDQLSCRPARARKADSISRRIVAAFFEARTAAIYGCTGTERDLASIDRLLDLADGDVVRVCELADMAFERSVRRPASWRGLTVEPSLVVELWRTLGGDK